MSAMDTNSILKVCTAVVGGVILLSVLGVAIYMLVSGKDTSGTFQNLFWALAGTIIPSPLSITKKTDKPTSGLSIGTDNNGIQLSPAYTIQMV